MCIRDRLVGRHIADMRLILNIRNEFEVYHDRLFAVERRMPGLTEDLLFALIVYKNTHLDDFEAIRLQSSRLDTMYRLWRHMVNSGIKAATDRERIARSSLDGRRSNTKRAREMGKLLLKVRGGLVAGGQFGAQLSQLFLDSAPVNDDEVQTPGFWTAIANGSQLSFGAPTTRYCLTFSADDLAAFLDLPYSPDQWGEVDVATHEATIAQARRDVWSLRHDTWKKLYASGAFTVSVGGDAEGTGGKTLTFRQLAERVLESQLARELVREGYLDENFALYVSTFYGEHVRPAATEYILRCVRSGEPDTAFLLEAEDVDAILAEEGDAVLRDPSMYNLSIVDHLLGSRPRDAATVIQRLLTWGENERTFVDAYVLRGADATGLISLLAGRWPRVFKYLVAEAPVDSEQRLALFDTALQACSTERTYERGEAIRDFINDNYAALRALREPVDINRAEAAFAVVEAAGSSLRSAAGLHEFAKREVINRRLYPVTAENLTTLAASNNIALDVLLEADEHIYAHALDHQRAYLDAVRESHSTTVSTVRDFAQIINDAAEADHAAGLDEIIRSANAECTVPRLAAVPPAAWPPLCASARTASTFANVQSYVAEFGEIDESLASLLGKRKAVEWRDVPEADRLALAATIVNAGESLPGVRLQVRLIRSLNPGRIPSTSIEPNSGILVANLIRSRLVADDAEAFSPRLMVDWPTLEAAIKASRRYETFVSPAVLPAHHVASLLRSAARDEIKQAVVTDLSAYLDDADGRAARAIGEALVLKGWRLPAILIEAVRAAGARSSDVARLLGQAGDQVTVEEIRALLRTLPDPYSKLADRKGYRPSVPDDQQHRALLDRLTDVVKNHKPDLLRPGIRKVTTYRR